MYSDAPAPLLLSANATLAPTDRRRARRRRRNRDPGRTVGQRVVLARWCRLVGAGTIGTAPQGSLAGHIVACRAQAPAAFPDFDAVKGYDYRASPRRGGTGRSFVCEAAGTGGLVTPSVVYEQLVLLDRDPRAYLPPDVLGLRQYRRAGGPDQVQCTGPGSAPTRLSRSRPPSRRFNVSAYLFAASTRQKAERVARALIAKSGACSSRAARAARAVRSTCSAPSHLRPHARPEALRVAMWCAPPPALRSRCAKCGARVPQAARHGAVLRDAGRRQRQPVASCGCSRS